MSCATAGTTLHIAFTATYTNAHKHKQQLVNMYVASHRKQRKEAT